MTKASFTGTVVWHRSEMRAEPLHDCICCDGPHVFARGIDIDNPELVYYEMDRNAVSQFHRIVSTMPENAHVRVTVEVIV